MSEGGHPSALIEFQGFLPPSLSPQHFRIIITKNVVHMIKDVFAVSKSCAI